MTNRVFIDSNVWVYALAETGDKRDSIARKFIDSAILDSAPVISYQVVNETMRVLRKLGKCERELREIIDNLFSICEVVGFTKESVLRASELRETMSVSYWDSQIVASALLAGCSDLISEDLQDGFLIQETLTVKNIFKD
ncbi:MAG: PIN domain-containing protein [Oscillospiraceae bacterium]|nr:PIN domain-containing protein [Oscillospiraceae bacterium]